MPGLASEAARLEQELAETRGESGEQRAKLASLRQIVEGATSIKEDATKLLSSYRHLSIALSSRFWRVSAKWREAC